MTTNTTAAAAARPTIGPRDFAKQFNELMIDSVAWVQAHWMQIVIAVAAAAAIVFVLHLLRRLGGKLCDHEATDVSGWKTVIGRAISLTGNFFIIMAAARLVSGYAEPPAGVARTIEVLWVIAATFQAAVWAREIILGIIRHRTRSSDYSGEALGSAMNIIRLLVTVAVFAVAMIVVLDNLGVNVTGLVAGLGVGGIAIGLAAQGIFSDLFAALSILFDKPFRRGDAVSYDTTSGTVEAIGLKTTRVRSITGEERVISNAQLLNKEIQNNTRRDHRRFKFALGLTYQTPVATLEGLVDMLRGLVEAHGGSFVRAGFINFGASSLDFELEFDSPIADYEQGYALRHKLGLAIIARFNDEGIEFAYPTQTTFTAAPDGRLIMPFYEPPAHTA